MKNLQRGFTLIELLIVIAVLGVLAVAVLSAINPIEQINRSRDTGSRSDSEQLINAIDRYYTSQGLYPWQANQQAADAQGWFQVDADWVDTGGVEVLTKLTEKLDPADPDDPGTGEIKQSFRIRISNTGDTGSYNPLFIYNGGEPGNSTYVCFAPKSLSFQDEARKRCTLVQGPLPSDFPEADACPGGAVNPYYICLP